MSEASDLIKPHRLYKALGMDDAKRQAAYRQLFRHELNQDIDAKDERAAAWYERFGAMRLLDEPLKLMLPLAVFSQAIARVRGPGR